MKCLILTAITLAALSITTVQAQQAIPVSPTPQPGSPGTATPTPYPQISPVPTPALAPAAVDRRWCRSTCRPRRPRISHCRASSRTTPGANPRRLDLLRRQLTVGHAQAFGQRDGEGADDLGGDLRCVVEHLFQRVLAQIEQLTMGCRHASR